MNSLVPFVMLLKLYQSRGSGATACLIDGVHSSYRIPTTELFRLPPRHILPQFSTLWLGHRMGRDQETWEGRVVYVGPNSVRDDVRDPMSVRP